MAFPILYPPQPNSPPDYLSADIGADDTTIYVDDGSVLPQAPNLLVIGAPKIDSEIVLMLDNNGASLNVKRGVGSVKKAWPKGASVARNFTSKDLEDIQTWLNKLVGMFGQPLGLGTLNADGAQPASQMSRGIGPLNLSINPLVPGGTPNQRGKATYNTVGQYTVDRKKLISGSTTVSGTGTSCTMTLNGTVREIVENPGVHAGQIITASIEDGEVSVGINGDQTPFAPSVTVTLPTTLTSLFVDVKAAGTIPKRLQITYGSERLPFVPRSTGEELALCQRYYEKSYAISAAPGSVTAAGSLIFVTLAVNTTTSIPFNFRKRATPSVVIYNPVTGEVNSLRNSTATANVAGVAASSVGDGSIGYVTTPNQTAPWSGSLHWVADAEL